MASLLRHLLQSVAPRPPQEIQPGPFDIQILGDQGFVAAVRGALDLLERSCPDHYQVVIGHVAEIESAYEGSRQRHQEPPRIALEGSIGHGRDLSPRSAILWYAGAIVHEAWHSRLYRQHRLEIPGAAWPTDERSALEREDVCLRVQHEVLAKMGAPRWMLDYVESGIGSAYGGISDRAW